MRSTLTFQRLCFLFLLSLTLAGCKKHQSADTPTILGLPSAVAYLGVDYYYDFGAYGGDNLLTYSLSNAPSWMALESTTNKVRPGIILHGVPGITGGRLGSADLGQFKNIGIYATDGSLLGGSTFNVQVKWNALSLSSATTVDEGKAYTPSTSSFGATTTCDMPATDVTGTLTDTGITTYDGSGNAIGTTQETFKTYPVIIPVQLTKPSVEPIAVAFQLTSKYDPTACDPGSTAAAAGQPQPRGCEFSSTNRNFAQLKRDVIASTGTLPNTPSYLSYNSDQLSGLLTIPAGKSTCFIRLEVTDDNFAEESESFALNLTEVRQGLATLTENGAQSTDTITIQDNEPTVTFSKTSDYVSKGTVTEYTAHLSEVPTVATSFYLGSDSSKTTLSASDYSFEDTAGQPLPYNRLVFPKGQQDVNFKVAVSNPLSSSGAYIDDRLLAVIPDMAAGYGRSNFAGAGTNAYIDIYINEWLNRLQIGSTGSFEPESMVVGDSGHVFLGGVSGGKLSLKMYDRTGTDQTSLELDPLDPTILTFPGNQSNVRLAYGEKTLKIDNTDQTRRELAIGFSTDTAINSSFTQAGGTDVAVTLLKRQASASTYTKEWSFQSGSSTDDTLTSIGLDSSNNVYLGGETTGAWGGVTPKGGNDIFLELLNNGSTVGSTTWSTLLGTSTDETLAALLPLGTNVYPVGTTSGYLATQDNNGPYGGVDGFFENLSSPSDTPKIYQFGTSQNDVVKAAAFGTGQQLWVIGDGYANYVAATNNQFQDPPTISSALNGFVATYSTSRALLGVTTLSDSNALANIRLTAIVPNGETAFIGGYIDTGGSFQDGVTAQHQDLILAELDNSTRGTISETWRLQQDDGVDERVVALGLYNGRKLVALVRQGPDGVGPYTYQIRTYKLDGTELTKP